MKYQPSQYPIGTQMTFRDLNLDHPTMHSVLVGFDSDGDYLLKSRRGTVGAWLRRDAWPVDRSKRINDCPPSRKVSNDCLGLSWQQIETMQGGKLS